MNQPGRVDKSEKSSDARIFFGRGCGFGLPAKFLAISFAALAVSEERAEQVRLALHRELEVPEELWAEVALPEDRCAATLALCLIAVQAHLRQVIAWKAVSIARSGGGFGQTFDSSLVVPYANGLLMSDMVPAIARWIGDPERFAPEALAGILATLSERHRKHLRAPVAKGILGFRALQLGYPLFEDELGGLVIGHGHKRRTFHGLQTDRSAVMAVRICSNKVLTARRLARSGLPTAMQRVVVNADNAAATAEAIGYPVVVKPADAERGIGVTNDLRSAEEVREAFAMAREASRNIVVERHVDGRTHRLTVVQGEVISAVQRNPGGVTGNGVDTVATLIDRFNAQPSHLRRTLRDGRPVLALDDEAKKLLKRVGMDTASVPANGVFVALRAKDNVRAGGTNDRLQLSAVHRDNLEVATLAAQAIMLDIAGVDLIIPDIARSWREQVCTICEVNADPELGNALAAYPFARMLSLAVGGPGDARIPLKLHVLPDIPREQGRPGMSTARWYCDAAGLWRDDQLLAGPFANGFVAAQVALGLSEITALDVGMTCGEVLQFGLPADRFTQIAILPMPQDRIGALQILCRGHGPISVSQRQAM